MVRLRSLVFVALCLAFALASIPAEAGRVRGTPVQVTFSDLSTDAITSDGQPGGDASPVYINAYEGVTATYDATGLRLKLGAARPREWSRTIHFGFATDATCCAAGCAAPTPPAMSWAPSKTTVYATPVGVAMADMPIGEPPLVPATDATIHFDTEETRMTYLVRFDPSMYAQSTYAHVVRVDADTWRFWADEDDVAVLVEPPTRQNPGGIDHGCYFMPFTITVDHLP
jgi:hypothetical protein